MQKGEGAGSVSPHQPSEVARAGVFRVYDGDVVARQHVHLPRGRTAIGLLAGVASPQRLNVGQSYLWYVTEEMYIVSWP